MVYTWTPAGGAWTVCPALDRHPRARHLSLTKDRHSHVKGPSSALAPRRRPHFLRLRGTRRRPYRPGRPTPATSTINHQHDEHNRDCRISPHPDSLRCPPVRSSHLRCIARIVDTKKPTLSPLHRLARLRVTRHLHHPPSGSSDRARVLGPHRAAPIAGLPPVSLVSQVLDLVTPYALRNPFGVVQHLLDYPAYIRVTSTESDRLFPYLILPSSTSQAFHPVSSVLARVQSLTASRALGYSRSQHRHRGPDPVVS
jgi:hypothetical protein